jgi:short-subunit dehydrogenase
MFLEQTVSELLQFCLINWAMLTYLYLWEMPVIIPQKNGNILHISSPLHSKEMNGYIEVPTAFT